MPIALVSREWLSENEARNYPLADHATGRDASGSFALPDEFLVELYWPVPWSAAVDSTRFYVQSVAAFATGYTVALGYDDGSGSPPRVALATVPASGFAEFSQYTLAGVGDYLDATGSITVGRLDMIALQPAGMFTFARAGGGLDPDCVRPQIRGLSALSVVSGGDPTVRLQGDVQLVAGTNIQLTVTGSSVRIDAVEGAGLTEACSCSGNAATAVAVRTINGIAPDNTGALTLVGDSCLTVTTGAGGFALADVCSKPCCGCTELETITAQLKGLTDSLATLRNFVSALTGEVTQMTQVVIGSKLSDSGCNTCA